MADDRERVTTRLSPEVYEQLCDELPSFNSDTARLQFLVQFYLDYKKLGHQQPPNQIICKETSPACTEENSGESESDS
jgi:hypothetical protein